MRTCEMPITAMLFLVAPVLGQTATGEVKRAFPTPMEAMRKAMEPFGPVVKCTGEGDQRRGCERDAGYRECLKAGEPVVLNGAILKMKAVEQTTLLFAFGLSDADRNGWLRECFRFLTEPGFRERYRALRNRCKVAGLFADAEGIYSLEAIYNLATDEALKAHVRIVHGERANALHAKAMGDWEEGREEAKARGFGDTNAPRPKLEVMRVWDLEKMRREATVMGP